MKDIISNYHKSYIKIEFNISKIESRFIIRRNRNLHIIIITYMSFLESSFLNKNSL